MTATKLDAPQVLKGAYEESQQALRTTIVSGLIPASYTKVKLYYTGSDMTKVEYYDGATLVTTLNLTYVSGNVTEIDKV
jgi:hypothetical protein